MSTISFADHMPNLLHSKDLRSEYSYFDVTKLKLFAGPNIWKYTNLLHSSTAAANTSANPSIIQHQQAPATRTKLITEGNLGPKRSFRVNIFTQISLDHIMSNGMNNRDKKSMSISQSALLLRLREKCFNQMQLARKLRPLTDLTNSHNFPQLNFERLPHIHRRQERQEEAIYHDDHDDHDFHMTMEHHDDEGMKIFLFDRQ